MLVVTCGWGLLQGAPFETAGTVVLILALSPLPKVRSFNSSVTQFPHPQREDGKALPREDSRR